jgi:ribosomal protein S8
MHSDPIADLLTRIRNGAQAHKDSVDVPHSKIKVEIVKILEAEGSDHQGQPALRQQAQVAHQSHRSRQQAWPARLQARH